MGVAEVLAGVLLILVMLAIALKYTLVEPSVAGAAGDEQRFELLAQARAEDERLTTTYGWVDKSKGIVRLPVGVAMQKLIEERSNERAGIHFRVRGDGRADAVGDLRPVLGSAPRTVL